MCSFFRNSYSGLCLSPSQNSLQWEENSDFGSLQIQPTLWEQLGEDSVLLHVSLLLLSVASEWELYGHFNPLSLYPSSALPREGYGGGLREMQGVNLPEWTCALGIRSSG